jgi:putative nucleotidyltransferase with HDIG domain
MTPHILNGNPGLRIDDSSARSVSISFSAIISALSFAIDLTEGAVPGHAVRTCVLGMRIAEAIGLPEGKRRSLYHALLLKDIGCSNNAARMCQIVGGDDQLFKTGAKLQDWTQPHRPTLDTLKLLWTGVLPKASAWARMARIGKIAATQHRNNKEMIALRCERGADIAAKLGLSEDTAEAIHALDEHWNGSGYPDSLKGEDIPLLSRILSVAQHLDVFSSERSPAMAMEVLRERSGRWFDPLLVDVVCDLDERGELWQGALPSDGTAVSHHLALSLDPDGGGGPALGVGSDQIDRICEAFADVVDAKSPFTYRHSLGVAEVATAMAQAMHLSPDRVLLVRRAALLHDLGKLAVANTILDKTSNLTTEEWESVVKHPRLTREILERIEPFAEIAAIAGAHHEKLDGSGYPEKLTGPDLTLEARIVAVADMYQALTEERPYREAMSHTAAMEILRRLSPLKLDAHCVAAVALVRDPRTLWTPTVAAAQQLPRKPPVVTGTTPVWGPALQT